MDSSDRPHRRGAWDRVWLAVAWRYACHSSMLLACLMAERIPAPTLSDRLIEVVPFVPFIARYNYHLWLVAYVPIALWFWRIDRDRFVEFMYTGGVISLLRGVTISLTSLGPVNGPDINSGKPVSELLESWLALVNPISALTTSAPHVYLTKDLFFSGHTASTFLLWLYVRRHARIGSAALAAHLGVVATVFLSHLHYTIDVIGAWAITFTAFTIAEALFERQRRTSVKGARARDRRGARAASVGFDARTASTE